MPRYERDYDPVFLALNRVGGDRHQRMRAVADTLWSFFKDHGVSWVGFYTKVDDADEMVLGPSRDTPACSPIGLHGACGQVWAKRRAMIVADIASLGAGYIACDPRDRSEVVLPLFDQDGACYGVLDIDSHERDAFGEHDARSLKRLMESTGISWPSVFVEPLFY